MKQVLLPNRNEPIPLDKGSRPKRVTREWFMVTVPQGRIIKQHTPKRRKNG